MAIFQVCTKLEYSKCRDNLVKITGIRLDGLILDKSMLLSSVQDYKNKCDDGIEKKLIPRNTINHH